MSILAAIVAASIIAPSAYAHTKPSTGGTPSPSPSTPSTPSKPSASSRPSGPSGFSSANASSGPQRSESVSSGSALVRPTASGRIADSTASIPSDAGDKAAAKQRCQSVIKLAQNFDAATVKTCRRLIAPE